MRFLADQGAYASTIGLLRRLHHDVVTVAQFGMARAADIQLLRIAHDDRRIFVTRDRHFGGLVFVHAQGGGVIYLRILPSALVLVHLELERALSLYTELELADSFVVIEPGRHRIRRNASEQGTP